MPSHNVSAIVEGRGAPRVACPAPASPYIWWRGYGCTEMKTTLNLDDRLVHAAKELAAERRVTLTRIVEDALRVALSEPSRREGQRIEWPTVRGAEPPAIDISDRNELYDRMEGRS